MGFVSNFLGKLTGAQDQADAIQQGAATQSASVDKGIAAQQAALDQFTKALAPFVNAGTGALTGQQNLLGLNGGDAQQTAISGLQSSPAYQALSQSGQDAILANASATGGLRGGNVQGALAQFQPQLLAQLIQQQYGNLGNLSTMGANAAAGVGNAGMQTGSNVANLLQQQGAAIAGGQIAQGSVGANGFGNLLGIGGGLIGAKKAGVF